MKTKKIVVSEVNDILLNLNYAIKYKKPFSLIRFGDGGLKLMNALFKKDLDQLYLISQKEGIPLEKMTDVLNLWGYYARRADYIDSATVYFSNTFWKRIKSVNTDGNIKQISEKTMMLLASWAELYYNAEIENTSFCNPEINYLVLLRDEKIPFNLLDIIKNKKICIITARPSIKSVLRFHNHNVDVFCIVSQYENQYENSFSKVVDFIIHEARNYDLFLNASGELGRIYTGIIKEYGGRCFDLGFVAEFWSGFSLHPRLRLFMKRNPDCDLELVLTEEGKKYQPYL